MRKRKNKEREIEKKFVIIGIIALAVSLMAIAGIAIANSLDDNRALKKKGGNV